MKLFGSSPYRPTLAADFDILDFALELHHRTTPNKTAFAESLEALLFARSYDLGGKVSTIRCDV